MPPLLPGFIPHCVIQTGCLAKATGCTYLPLCRTYPSLPLHLTLTLNDYFYRVQLLRSWWSLSYKGTKFLAYFFVLCNEGNQLDRQCEKNEVIYRVSIKSFPNYKHLLQQNYTEYKHIFSPLLKLVSKIVSSRVTFKKMCLYSKQFSCNKCCNKGKILCSPCIVPKRREISYIQ